ncbi:MAG TPA: molybdopterin cofactor-binding domain-containing protein [Candidatus Binatia bacterium]|nr:molybdopterin cofactor-binding domain-containing protein [Candidatus Binatia bacterium]
MKNLVFEAGMEPERYELDAPIPYRFSFKRRSFFKTVGAGIIVLGLLDKAVAQESGRRGGGRRPAPQDIGAWLHIGEDGQITVYSGKAEVGQNIRTSLAQAVAEELRVPVSSVRMVMADTQLTPYDAGTFGSRTTPDMARTLRRVGAAAREILIDLAAEEWKVDRASIEVADGKVIAEKSKQQIEFGKLTKGQKLTKAVPENPSTSVPAARSAPKANADQIVTGRHKYASDAKVPGMLHGKVLRPSAFKAEIISVDTSGVADATVVRDGNFVGVVAPNDLFATRAIKAIKVEWKAPEQISHKELFEHLKKRARPADGGRGGQRTGSIKEGLESADVRNSQTYTVAYIAHAPLEPRAAVAQWEGDKLTVWTGTQRPFGVRGDLASAFRISEDNVRVIVPDTGSGYGGKHSGEAAVEAARLARGAGKPVKLVWTREEEFTWAYFRPAGVIEISSGARKDGTLTAWECHNYNSGASALRTPYSVANLVSEFHSTDSPLKQGSYRALASTANTFARESHMDELAHALKLDPLEFRLKNLNDVRLRAVLDAAAKSFGWGKKPKANRGFGIAASTEKGSYVATCAEIAVDAGKIKVVRAVTAFECGAIVNPEHLKNQIEGGVVMGIGGALFEAIQFENGRIINGRFSDYRVPRFSDTPELETVLVNRKDLPSAGAGETPIIGIAPAIGNAVFAATGKRLRSMPFSSGLT